jgi:hypothetical protein
MAALEVCPVSPVLSVQDACLDLRPEPTQELFAPLGWPFLARQRVEYLIDRLIPEAQVKAKEAARSEFQTAYALGSDLSAYQRDFGPKLSPAAAVLKAAFLRALIWWRS